MKISDSASFSLQLFVFVHVPAIFSVFIDMRIISTAYFFGATLYIFGM